MKNRSELYKRPQGAAYAVARFVGWVMSHFVYRRSFRRNELKDVQGPFVVIANHQSALDAANLIGATRRRLTFVLSNSFYHSLPVSGLLTRLGVIVKQQFQTELSDMKRMKSVLNAGEGLVLYPAGMMCEDGVSTPIPPATYAFLKWLGADVYMARCEGNYFVMPKWTKGLRPGKTYMDIYRLFTKEELATLPEAELRARAEQALMFDAYREQETLHCTYKNNDDIRGLENVLYQCPACEAEFSMRVPERSELVCTACGYAERSDAEGFLHRVSAFGPELRYVPDWSRRIYTALREKLRAGEELVLSCAVKIDIIDRERKKFVRAGTGKLTFTPERLTLCGELCEQPLELSLSSAQFPTLPFKPGRTVELQHGREIYRCSLHDGALAMKFIALIKANFELQQEKASSRR